ncbi:MAG: PH domain-containing protein [Micromonosporaceae bacterium]
MSGTNEPVTFRPRRIRRVCWVLAPVVVAVFIVLATVLARPVGEGGGVFGASDRVAMIMLGILAALGILAFTRPRVTADQAGVKIQNVIGGYQLPWEVVRSVRFERGSPWLSLELHDDDVVAVMAIQAADKEYAVAGARALRTLLAEHQRGADAADRTC